MVVTAVFTIVIILVPILTLRYYVFDDGKDDDSLRYAPTDTRLISTSGILCQNLKISVNHGSANVHMYMLDFPPKLTGHESFKFSAQPKFSQKTKYYVYYFYMHHGSYFNVSACTLGNVKIKPVIFFMIKGYSHFQQWQNGFDHKYGHFEDKFKIQTDCHSGHDTGYYKIVSEDYYYLVLLSDMSEHYQDMNFFMSIYRTRYEIGNSNDVLKSCSNLDSEYCILDLPLFGPTPLSIGTTPLLVVEPTDTTVMKWETDKVGIKIECVPRIWSYVTISAAILLVISACCIFFCIAACIRMFMKKHHHSCLCQHKCWLVFMVILIAAVILSTAFTVRYFVSGDRKLQNTPTDTQVISISSILCSGVKFDIYDDSGISVDVNLYSLDSRPKLTGHESFNLSILNASFDDGFYYMNPGSTVTISGCVKNESTTFYICMIKGYSNYQQWNHHFKNPYFCENIFEIEANCENTSTYTVTSADYYYLSLQADTDVSFYVNVNFNRTHYGIRNSNILDSCFGSSIGTKSCTVSLPLFRSTPLLVVKPVEDEAIDWMTDRVDIDIACVPRIWTYVIISIAYFIGGLIFSCKCIIICIQRVWSRINNQRRGPVNSVNRNVAPTAPPTVRSTAPPIVRSNVPRTVRSTVHPTMPPTTMPSTVLPTLPPTIPPTVPPAIPPTMPPAVPPTVPPAVPPTAVPPTVLPAIPATVPPATISSPTTMPPPVNYTPAPAQAALQPFQNTTTYGSINLDHELGIGLGLPSGQ